MSRKRTRTVVVSVVAGRLGSLGLGCGLDLLDKAPKLETHGTLPLPTRDA